MAPIRKPVKRKKQPTTKRPIADPAKPTAGRRNTGNHALVPYKGEPNEGSARMDLPMQRWFEHVDMPQLESALAISAEKRFTELLRVMHHPFTRTWSMTRIAKRCGLTLADLTKFWRDSRMQQAMMITSDALPGIMTDIVHDASNKPAVCPRCDGYGTLLNDRHNLDVYGTAEIDDSPALPVYEGRGLVDGESSLNSKPLRPCPECAGSGAITRRGDGEARKMLLEAGGITGKKSPVIMQQHNHFPGSVENFVDKWDKEDDTDVIDAEVEDIKTDGSNT